MNRVDEFKLGRLTVKAGDLVTVKGVPGYGGFVAKVLCAKLDEFGDLIEVDVLGSRGNKPLAYRTFPPDRLIAITMKRMEKLRQARAERLDVRPAVTPKKRKKR